MHDEAGVTKHRSRKRGQGLVEYALILVLVALVVMLAAFVVGLAAQRIYGVVAGALGAKHNTIGQHIVEITSAQCFASTSAGQTGLWIVGNTNESVADLTGSTDQAVGTGENGVVYPVEPNGSTPNSFLWRPRLATTVNINLCPKSVVIQAKDGAIAVSPVTAAVLP